MFKFFSKVLILSFFFSYVAQAKTVMYSKFDKMNKPIGTAIFNYSNKGYATNINEENISVSTHLDQMTTIIIGDRLMVIMTGDDYWHKLGLGVMRNSTVVMSSGEELKRGMLHQSHIAKTSAGNYYQELFYLDGVLILERDVVVDEDNEIVWLTQTDKKGFFRLIRNK